MVTSRVVTITFNPKRLLSIWSGMKDRCHNPKSKFFKYYGGRSKLIFVCERWRNSFGEFAWWAIHNGYSDKLTIERINNDRGYTHRNCRWVTLAKQQSNRTNNVFHTIGGKKQTASEWCRELNIPHETFRYRVKKSNDINFLRYGKHKFNRGEIK